MKIYENANDQHVRKVVLYEVGAGLAFDKAGTELLAKEEIVDAFLKGCVVENEGNYKTPTGVNVTDSGAELVFGGEGGSGGGAMIVNVDFDDSLNATADKTVVELEAAFRAGQVVRGKILVNGEDVEEMYNLVALTEGALVFGGMWQSDDRPRFFLRGYHDSDEDTDIWSSSILN